ncbi:MAG: DUF115 domain-containing protein [Deltaproteobacteria bacterium]|nr:DUF115 domain-containing protein [Candidatus Anaeroferrophillacea bacterium]
MLGTVEISSGGLPVLMYEADDGRRISSAPGGDPWAASAVHLETVPRGSEGLAVFIGLGLGYGPLLVHRERQTLKQLAVVEPDIDVFRTALRCVDLRPLLEDPKVCWFLGEIDWPEFEAAVAVVCRSEDTHVLRHLPAFQWREAVYRGVNDQAIAILNKINVAGGTMRRFGEIFLRNRFANYALAGHAHLLDILHDRFAGMPAILVASGPSLDQSLQALREACGRCLLIAVDGALAPLLAAGIMPDVVTTADINDFSFEKMAPFLDREWPFTLLSVFKVVPSIPKRMAVRHLLFTTDEDFAQAEMIAALGLKHLVPEVSSVAHLSLGLALVAGANPIVFIGQDLSFPPLTTQHARGVINIKDGKVDEPQYVPGIRGGRVLTNLNLLEIKTRLEDVLAAYPRTYINASAHGAHIEGTRGMSLEEVVARLLPGNLQAGEIIADAAAADEAPLSRRLIGGLGVVQDEIVKARGELRRALNKCGGLTKELVALGLRVQAVIHGKEQLSPVTGRRVDQLQGLLDRIERRESLWHQVAELTFPLLTEHDRRKRENAKIKKTDYLGWLVAEIDRLRFICTARTEALDVYEPLVRRLLAELTEEQKLKRKRADRPDDLSVQFALVRHHVKAENYAVAARLLDGISDRGPEYLFWRGVAETRRLAYGKAEETWRQLRATAPEYRERIATLQGDEQHHWLEMIAAHGTQYRYFRLWLERVLTLPLGDEAAARLAGWWERDLDEMQRQLDGGDYAVVQRQLERWQPYAMVEADWFVSWAALKELQQDIPAALDACEAALARQPANSDLPGQLARLLILAGRHDEGLARLRQAVERDPEQARMWEVLGDSLRDAGDREAAIQAYEQCYLALPGHLDALAKLGLMHLLAGRPEAAREAFRAVLQKNPEHQEAWEALGRAEALLQHVSRNGEGTHG